MNEVKNFENEQFGNVRTMTLNNEPWVVGKDIADALGYTNPPKALRDHVDTEDKTVNESFTVNGTQGILINESGVYSLIMASKLPAAKEFKRWVTHDVLPDIRKHGMYATDDLLNDPDLAIAVFNKLKQEREERRRLEAVNAVQAQEIEAARPKVAFADAVASSPSSILIGELAKLLRQNGIDTGERRLFAWLRDNGYLMKSGSGRNLPTQKAIEMDLFEIKESTIPQPDGRTLTKPTTKVTGKGQQLSICF